MRPLIRIEIVHFGDYLWIGDDRCGDARTENVLGSESMQMNGSAFVLIHSDALFVLDEFDAIIFAVKWLDSVVQELKLSAFNQLIKGEILYK